MQEGLIVIDKYTMILSANSSAWNLFHVDRVRQGESVYCLDRDDFMKRVIGIGNALTDMLVNLKTDKVLDTFNLPKGSMSLVDAALQTEISKSVAGLPYSLSLGGSAGNTIRAMARLGCDVGFIGKVGTDKTGDFFIQALENLGTLISSPERITGAHVI